MVSKRVIQPLAKACDFEAEFAAARPKAGAPVRFSIGVTPKLIHHRTKNVDENDTLIIENGKMNSRAVLLWPSALCNLSKRGSIAGTA